MGYRPQRKLFHVTFQGTDFDGWEVWMRELSIEQLADLLALQSAAEDRNDAEALRSLVEATGEQIDRWNVEDDDGVPILPSHGALVALGLGHALALIDGWLGAMVSVPGPLDSRSTNGVTPPVTIPHTPLPPN